MIFTKNTFIKIALRNILKDLLNRNAHVIDLSSFTSLHEMISCLSKHGVMDDAVLILIEGQESFFSMQLKHITYDKAELMSLNLNNLFLNKSPSFFEVKSLASTYFNFDMLSKKEHQCVYALYIYSDIKCASSFVDISKTVFYGHISKASVKMNLNTLLNMKLFLFREKHIYSYNDNVSRLC